jgi:ferredoxin-type protein NapH
MELKAMESNRIQGRERAVDIALVAIFAFEAYFFCVSGRAGEAAAGGALWGLFCVACFALIAGWRKPALGRGIFFFASALCFAPAFIAQLIEARGHMALSGSEIAAAQVPFCHIAITTSLLPAALFRTLDFPAQLSGARAAFYPMLVYWLLSLVTVGRGWCAWVCFYGGVEDGLSSLPKKARLDLAGKGAAFRRFNYAVLAFVALAGVATLVPVYCDWLCPFKLVTEYVDPVSARGYLALIAFVGLYLALVVVLPILSKKRSQCSILCPFGALSSLLDRISPFRVSIDRSACVSCGACDRACPMLALDPALRESGRPASSCVKCGRCFAACPKKAIGFSFRGLPFRASAARGFLARLLSPDLLFPFTAMSFGMIISQGFSSETLIRLIHLARTGSFLLGGPK